MPPPAPPGAGGGADDGLRTVLPEALGVPAGASRRKRRLWLSVAAVSAVLGGLGGALLAYAMIGPSVTKENDSNKAYDASQPPFTVSVQPEQSEPQEWVMVLDRTLTDEEVRKMKASSDVFSYLKSLGGRPLAYAPFLEHAPQRYNEVQTSSGRMEFSDTFKMTVMSTRQYAVTINDWKVTDLTCRKSTAQAVIGRPSQGGAAYEGIRLHLPPRADEPVLTDDTEGQGEPYFGNRFVEVGNGQSSGGLRAEVIAPRGQTCEWGIQVHYNDTHRPEGRWVQLKDDKGGPLRVRTESVPENPRQSWVFGPVPWTSCHDKPEGNLCSML
ncbi:hypothetical protein [Streptomyces sp. NPDC050388]|uniref:hypothetical protein n=1 Tax=Streptomyces sp. NPDC050388 TaxID=3155781 RepID=UPI0034404CAF